MEAWASERNSRPCMWKYRFHKRILGATYGNVNLREEFYALYVKVLASEEILSPVCGSVGLR
jgi:hypothetical protein